jgi:hypothetical protein
MLHGRRRSALAVVAVAVLVALFIVLFYRFTAQKSSATPSHSSQHVADQTGTVTNFPVQQQYGDMIPIVAPSNPNEVYKLVPINATTDQVALARSDDGGVTWQTFAVPTLGSDSKADAAFVSPLNPQEVFLSVYAQLSSGVLDVQPLQPHEAMLAEHTAPGRVCAGATSRAPRRPLSVETSGAPRNRTNQHSRRVCPQAGGV